MMKTLIKIALIIIAFLLGNDVLKAQSEQLNRDIRIAERILEEIFSEPSGNQERVPHIRGGVQGEYIPGIGVHFKMGRHSVQRILIIRNGQDQTEQNNASRIDSDWVEERMMDYFTQYAGQLRGLPDGEQIRLSYGIQQPNRSFAIFSTRNESTTQPPKLSMWVSKADVRNYTEGNLSEAQFRNRISKHDLSNAEEKRDLNIFASVLETAINSSDSEHLRVNRSPSYEYLPGLGAHFQVTISSGMGFNFSNLRNFEAQFDDFEFDDMEIEIDIEEINRNIPENFSFQIPRIDFNNDSLHISLRRMTDSLKVQTRELNINTEAILRHAEEAQRQGESIRRQIELQMAQQDSVDLSGDVARIMDDLKETIKDYGSTLSSISNEELLMITINWSGRNSTLPERTHIRITKSDLINGREPIIEEIRRR